MCIEAFEVLKQSAAMDADERSPEELALSCLRKWSAIMKYGDRHGSPLTQHAEYPGATNDFFTYSILEPFDWN